MNESSNELNCNFSERSKYSILVNWLKVRIFDKAKQKQSTIKFSQEGNVCDN